MSAPICLLRAQKLLSANNHHWSDSQRKPSLATGTLLLRNNRGGHFLSHSRFMLGVCIRCMHLDSCFMDALHKTKHFWNSEKGSKSSLLHSKTKPIFFGVNANLEILFVWYENMSQNGHILFRSSKNLRNGKQRKPSGTTQGKRNKLILWKTLEDQMLRQP